VQHGELVLRRPERRAALDRGVEGGAQGEHVGRRSRLLPAGDLRGQVGRSARHHPGLRDGGVARGSGHPEVGDLGEAGVTDQDVAGLDVPVHDPGRVRSSQRRGDLAADACDVGRGQRAALGQHRREAARRHVLQYQARLPLVLSDVEHHDGVGVLQPGGYARLAQRPLVRVGGLNGGKPRLQQQLLDRDHPL
jgi:hypothetical protein